MFGSINPYSAMQDYIWVAEYYGGGINEENNSFYDIEKEKLQRFGLIGKGQKMWFECYRGPFNIDGDVYEFIYGDYKLTGQKMFQRDIITFKKAYADIDITKRAGSSSSKIVGYYFGYKTEFEIDGIIFNFKPILCKPVGGELYFDIHLVSSKDLKEDLSIIKNSEVVDIMYAPLKKNVAGGVKWRVI